MDISVRNLKKSWNKLSLSARLGIRSGSYMIGFAGAIAAGGLFLPLGGLIATGALITAGVVGVVGATALAEVLPTLKNELRHGQDTVTWVNEAGQKVTSTKNQKTDLTTVKGVTDRGFFLDNNHGVSHITASPKLTKKFIAVANKVTVAGGKPYRFPAAKGPTNG